MPKEVFEIKGFVKGIVSTVDTHDIPADACTFSLDLDNVTDGSLIGRASDTAVGLHATDNTTYFEKTKAVIAMADDTLVFFNLKNDGVKVYKINDFDYVHVSGAE